MSDTKTLLSIAVNEAKNEMHVSVEGDPVKLINLIGKNRANPGSVWIRRKTLKTTVGRVIFKGNDGHT